MLIPIIEARGFIRERSRAYFLTKDFFFAQAEFCMISQAFTAGRSARYGRNLINEIKLKLKKEPHQFVTIQEFADYSGLDIEVVKSFIID